MLKKIFIYFLILIFLNLIIFLMILSYKHYNKRFIKNIKLSIDNNNNLKFINKKNIQNFIYTLQNQIKKKNINKIKIYLIEKKLKKLDFIKKAEVYIEIGKELNINIIQKKPIARIKINSKNYYLTKDGSLINAYSYYSPEVLLVEGLFSKNEIKILKELIEYINNDELLKNQIIGIQKISLKSFNLLPKIGNYIIEFGDLLNYRTKFKKLKSFYKQYIQLIEEKTYKKIRLQYNGQVVAEKI